MPDKMGYLRKMGNRTKKGPTQLHVTEGNYKGLRLHLRFEEDGTGIRTINASRVLFLSRTAADYVHSFIEGKTEKEMVREMRKRYRVDEETVLKDYQEVLFVVNTFAKTPDVCPVSYLGVEKIEPFEKELSVPYRMDLAITYRCNNNCIHCYAGGPRETKELSTDELFAVLDRIEKLGIPHVVFTGGEPTLREDLTKLIAHTQQAGLVSGLVTNGKLLKDGSYFNSMVDAGLDHVQITLESYDPKVHDKITGVEGSWKDTLQGLKNAIASPIYTLSNTTLNKWNVKDIVKTIEFLHNLGLKQFACNSLIYSGKAPDVVKDFALEDSSLEPILTEIKNKANELGMEFIWYTPTEYCILDPLQLELGIKSCSACRISMCIEPDGTVIPCQSYFTPLGNILKDDWGKIWKNPLCLKLRARKYVPEKCFECPTLHVCGGGCPLKGEKIAFSCSSTAG
ncbi:radical SAM protein [Candidatus Bathyarchaeota archaeon]|nr:radical SAM protein [Candidatus Bathyarchaeota archaeon]